MHSRRHTDTLTHRYGHARTSEFCLCVCACACACVCVCAYVSACVHMCACLSTTLPLLPCLPPTTPTNCHPNPKKRLMVCTKTRHTSLDWEKKNHRSVRAMIIQSHHCMIFGPRVRVAACCNVCATKRIVAKFSALTQQP